MTPSPILKAFLTDGTKPASQRETSALLDETFSLLQELVAGRAGLTNASHMPAAEFNARAQTALAKSQAARQPATIHQNTNAYRTAQGRAPLAPVATVPANKFEGAPVRVVVQAATHRSSPEADRVAAQEELRSRGVAYNPDGTIPCSIRGGRAVKLAAKALNFQSQPNQI